MAQPDFQQECAKYPVGTRVRYSASMLQACGPTGKRWNAIVIAHSMSGNFLVVDEATNLDLYTEAELETNPLLAYRHISPFAVMKARKQT